MTDTRRTGLRRLWYIASWRARYWWLDTRGGMAARAVLALAVLVATVGWIWRDVAHTPPAGQPLQAIADWAVYAIMFVVSIFISLALAPKPKNAEAQRVQVAQVEEGATLKRIYGPVWIDDPHVIGDKPNGTVPIRKKAGKTWQLKTKWQTVAHWYKRIFHFLLSVGPIDKVMAIRGADKEAWVGELTSSGSITVSKPDLWGGEDSEGGIDGVFEFMFGEADQAPNAYLAANLSPKQSAYRGRTSVVFKGGRWGTSPYFKSPSFLVSRIFEGWDNNECWYPEKAQVPVSGEYDPGEPLTTDQGYYRGGVKAIVEVTETIDIVELDIPSLFALELIEAPYYDTSNFPRRVQVIAGGEVIADTGWVGNPTYQNAIDYGIVVQADPLVIESVTWGLGDPIEDGRGKIVNATRHIPAGVTELTVRYTAVVATNGSVWMFWRLRTPVEDTRLYGMNVAHALYDSLTSKQMDGEPVALLHDASWRAAADRLYQEGFGIGTTFNASSETVEQFQQRLCDLIAGRLSKDPTTGLWHLDLIRDDIGLADLPVLTDDDIVQLERQPATLDEAVNQVVVEWFDPIKKENRSTGPEQSLGAIQAFGSVNGEVRTFREIIAAGLAQRVASRELRARSPVERITATVTRIAYSWRTGQKFAIQAPRFGVSNMVCVLGDIDRGSLKSGAIRLSAVQDVGQMPQTSYVAPEPGVDTSQPTAALPAPGHVAFETPYRDLLQVLSDAEIAGLPATAGFISSVAVAPPGAYEFRLLARADGGSFEEVGTFDFAASAVVVEGSSRMDPEGGVLRTSFTLADGHGLESVVVGMAALWGDEICRVDAIDTETLDIELGRGCADTVPAEHAPGSTIWFYDGWEAFDPNVRQVGQVVEAKVLPRTGSDELPAARALAVSVELNRRAARPYPPQQLKLNGEYIPAEPTPPFVFTWVHRDRVGQGDALVDASEGSVGPEVGTTYTLRNVDVLTGSELYVESGIEGTSHELPPEYTALSNRVEVFAVRDGLESWQRATLYFNAGFEIEGEIGKVIAAGFEYEVELAATGPVGSVTWSIEGGDLPDGWDLTGNTLGGTASAPGDYHFLIQAEDESGAIARRWVTLKIAVAAAMIPGTGSDGSSTFSDLTGKAWTVSGSPQISTSDSDFGDGGILFPAGGGASLRAESADFTFGVGDYTMQVAAKVHSVARNRNLLSWQPNAPTNSNAWTLYTATNNIWYVYSVNSATNILNGGAADSSKHVRRYSRANGMQRLYRGGSLQASVYNAQNFDGNKFAIGGNAAVDTSGFAGLVGDIYVIKGIGLQTLPLAPMAKFPLLVEGDVGRAKSFWRIVVLAINNVSSTNAAMAELQFRKESGGSNLAVGGTPIADSQWSGTYSPDKAFDGNPATYWSSLNPRVPNAWLGYQFAGPVEVNAVLIRALSTVDAGKNEPMQFVVQSSDDAEVWFDEWSVSVGSDWTYGETREFVRP